MEINVEQCDDGNILNDDGCSAACLIELEFCGNGLIEDGEQCDDGNDIDDDFCDNDCNIVLNDDDQVCFCHNVNKNPHTICTSLQGYLNGHQKHGDPPEPCEGDEGDFDQDGTDTIDGQLDASGQASGCALYSGRPEESAIWLILAAVLSSMAVPVRRMKRN